MVKLLFRVVRSRAISHIGHFLLIISLLLPNGHSLLCRVRQQVRNALVRQASIGDYDHPSSHLICYTQTIKEHAQQYHHLLGDTSIIPSIKSQIIKIQKKRMRYLQSNLLQTIWYDKRMFGYQHQKSHGQNNQGDIATHLYPSLRSPVLSSLFCKHKNPRCKSRGRNKQGEDNRLLHRIYPYTWNNINYQ